MHRTGLVMIVVAWLLVGGVIWLAMANWLRNQETPAVQVSERAGEIVLRRNRAGHFQAPGEINGVPVTFLVDTGATGVALSSSVARRVGARPGRAVRSQTARGETISYLTRLDRVSLGNMSAHDVGGSIVPEMTEDAVLLGMSFLSRFDITMSEGVLRLHAPDALPAARPDL